MLANNYLHYARKRRPRATSTTQKGDDRLTPGPLHRLFRQDARDETAAKGSPCELPH